MTVTAPPTTKSPIALPEQRVLFHNISWEGYEKILSGLGDDRAARLTYDRGTLEIYRDLYLRTVGFRWGSTQPTKRSFLLWLIIRI
ncbi:MAG: hypothetical protein AB4352_24720 [Hormoscilla sp.]